MNNKTIIEFGLRRIPELFKLQCYLFVDLGLNNSGYPAQPHRIIVNKYDVFSIYYKKIILDEEMF